MDLKQLQELNDLRLTIEMYNDLMDKYDDEDFVLENLDNILNVFHSVPRLVEEITLLREENQQLQYELKEERI
ncbi:hypothetical protein [Bacillus paranthracis]|uniref:hypothetical protein n=1 Tax=Bacillus paranthracis TaxID=2026186 RepID=UPI0021CE2E54|nr:hypothetical protein [Bacillus paranthracis]MCU5173754.1 hypothetical protein [Bacillus paranthracis]